MRRSQRTAPGSSTVAVDYHNVASALSAAGRYDEALTQFAKAIAIQKQALDPGHPDRAHPLMGMATVYRRQGRYAEAEPLLREALALRRSLPPDHRYIAEALGDLGECRTRLDRHDEAAAALHEAHAILVATRAPDDRLLIRSRERLLELAHRSSRPELADPPISTRL